ncbi:MAG: TIGR01906 family membrane protein [Chloroflexota bacterium]|nr:MAG: TIGR01906 family membrane protein [Chloroflexota bacterium]
MTEKAQESVSSGYQRWLSWVVAILVPLVLILTSVRLLLTPAFVQLEYRTPNFPPDPYGFTQEDRLHWSMIALDYLLNDEGINFLAELQFEDGSPLYNARELKHMVDVKNVVQSTLIVWYACLAGIILLGIWAYFGGWMGGYKQGLSNGGWITVVLVAVTMVAVLIAFSVFFVFFHDVFFDPGTWVFRFSDTLIRLFPERFWRDTFIAIGLLSLAAGLALGLGFRKKTNQA